MMANTSDITYLYLDKGLSCKEVARQLNIGSPMTVYKRLVRAGYKPRSPSEGQQLRWQNHQYPEVSISSDQEQVILGTLFGDGNLRLQQGNHKTPYFSTVASDKNKEYLLWKLNKLKPSGLFPNGLELCQSENYIWWRLRSISHPIFLEFRTLFYRDGRKVVSKDALDRLDKLGIAIWYSDDGNFGSRYQIFLATQSFTFEENMTIKEWFASKHDLPFHIYRDSYQRPFLGLPRQKKVQTFLELVSPHIHQSMSRKLGL